jgi:hypothetical protein
MDFNDRWNGLTAPDWLNPSVGLGMALDPTVIKTIAVRNGIAPPPIASSTVAEPEGDVWNPTPAAEPQTPVMAQGGEEGGKSAQKGNSILETLKGIKLPAPPKAEMPSIRSPAAPTPHGTIQGGQLLQLLNAMGLSDRPPTALPRIWR